MSLKYIDHNQVPHDIAGLTPGGDLEYGAVATREGLVSLPQLATGYTQVDVTFDTPMPDSDYEVVLSLYYSSSATIGDLEVWASGNKAQNKTASHFLLFVFNAGSTIAADTVTVQYKAFKLYDIQYAEQNHSDILDIQSYIPSTTTRSNKLINDSQLRDALENVEIDVDDTLSTSSENPVQNKVLTAALNGKQGLIFTGTQAEWNSLSLAQKTAYTFCNITDDTDYVGNIVDAVVDGNMSAITSNAVSDALDNKQDKLTNPLTKSDVVNNLTTSTTNVPLSAAQGKAVNDKLTNFMSSETNYVGVRNANNAVTGGVGSNGHAFVLGGNPSDTKHVNIYYDGSNVYCDGKFNSTSKTYKLNDSCRSYSVTLSSKVQWVAGTPTRTNNTFYFGYVIQVKSGQTLAANETILTLPENTNVWCAIPNNTSNNGNYQIVINGNKVYCEQSISSEIYITLMGSCPIA